MNMKKMHPVVTLCGSTRFKEEFHEVAEKFTKHGFVVLYPSCYNRDDNDPALKDTLVSVHKQMIGMSDAIIVINKNDYIGESTKSEIAFTESLGKMFVLYYKYIDDMEIKFPYIDKFRDLLLGAVDV